MTARFWSKVTKTSTCWLWTAHIFPVSGYGQFSVKRQCIGAHRFAWIDTYGPIPKGMCVLHKCDVRHCVNPSHLFLGTNADNSADMVKKGRSTKGRAIPHPNLTNVRRGETHGMAKLTMKEVRDIRSLYLAGTYLQREIGAMYGVKQGTISQIVNKQKWKAMDLDTTVDERSMARSWGLE